METLRSTEQAQRTDYDYYYNYHIHPAFYNPISDNPNLQFTDNNHPPNKLTLLPSDNDNPKPRRVRPNPSQTTDMETIWTLAQTRQNCHPSATSHAKPYAIFENPNPGTRALSALAPPPPNYFDGYRGCVRQH